MSLITVKCNSCNVVINELLAFLRNVLDVMDEESVHQLCTSSFTAEEIVKAKTLLFESIPSGKKMPVRRKNGKKKVSRDLDDMICLLKGSDPELFPIFVAKELHKLPPVSFDHVDVTKLLKDLLQLQNKIKMATSVLQPEDCRREHEPKPDIIEAPRLTDDDRMHILEAKERETGELPPELREKARTELREEPALREQALAQMRHFIEKHPAIKKCRTDSPFLLRFLRTKKYSIPQACSMLERYLTIRQMYPQWFQKLDPLDPKIAAVIDAGYLVPLPKRDAEGRRVVLSCMGRFDPHQFDNCVMARVHSMIVELLLDEPRSQLLGYTHVNDEAGMQMPHVSLWSLTDVRIMLNCIQNSTPMRHKRTHFVNIPTYGIKFFEFAVSLLSDKLKDRVMFHRTSEDLMKHVDPAILPKEYGGTVPLRDMIEELKRNLLKRRDDLLSLDDMCVDLHALEKNDLTQDIHSTAGSFRKLELD